MSDELFVDGICEFDDEIIQTYFIRLNFPIKNYESHRHRPTNSCCFAIIQFESSQCVNAVLDRRPHQIDNHTLFVKRILPPSTCSFIERLLPVTSIFVYDRIRKDFDEEKLRKYFNTFGRIIHFEHDRIRSRLLIEYDDYDSVDRIFLNKDHLPDQIEVYKNISPRVQSTIEYHGTCRQKQQDFHVEEQKPKRSHRKQDSHFDENYQDLLQKTINELIHCKAELRNRDSEYLMLQLENTKIKDENEKLNQFINNQYDEQQITIHNLEQDLRQLRDQYEQLLNNIHRPTYSSFSTRLNSDRHQKSLSHSTMPTIKKIQSRIRSHQTI